MDDVITVYRSALNDQKRRGGSDALLRPPPDVVREDRAVGAVQGKGGISLPDREETGIAVITYMTSLAADENTRMRSEALRRVETKLA